MHIRLIDLGWELSIHTHNKDDGLKELNWYEVGGVIYDGKGYVYVGDIDIWPGMSDRFSRSINWGLTLKLVNSWQLGGLLPYDGVTDKVLVSIALPVTLISVVLAIAGIIFAVACLVFNFVFRKKR